MKSTLFTEEHKEVNGESFFSLQNESLLKVQLGNLREIIARKGSVVASRGPIAFTRLEAQDETPNVNFPLLRAAGDGALFVGDGASQVHLLLLEDESIAVIGDRVAAFDSRLRFTLRESKISGLPGGGFWKLQLTGSGSLALFSKGTPVLLRVSSEETTRTDLFSTVAWSASLAPQLKPCVKIDSHGQERFYLSFSGEGWVLVQPGE